MNTATMKTATTTMTPPMNGYNADGYDRTNYGYATNGVRPAAGPTVAATAPTLTEDGPRLDQVRYWVGASITAVLAALVSLIALIVAQGIVNVPMVLGSHSVHAGIYAVSAAGIALLAAALYDGMLHVAPRPLTYYSWLGAIVTALAALLPFTDHAAGLHAQIALAVTNFAVGAAITLLVPVAASNARRNSARTS
jgi:hypothetical protein